MPEATELTRQLDTIRRTARRRARIHPHGMGTEEAQVAGQRVVCTAYAQEQDVCWKIDQERVSLPALRCRLGAEG